jgi:16S rRNA (guanine966-N2)-methyltransferase
MLEARGGLTGLVVADLYCGSGALGIEALSRGASEVFFVDHDTHCLDAARQNLTPFNLPGEATYVKASLPSWNPPRHLDLVLADPPYGPLDLEALLRGVLAPRAVIENDRFMAAPAGWEVVKEKRYGTTFVTMLERTDDQ